MGRPLGPTRGGICLGEGLDLPLGSAAAPAVSRAAAGAAGASAGLPDVLGWSGVAEAITRHLRHGLLLPKRCTLWGACVERTSDCMVTSC